MSDISLLEKLLPEALQLARAAGDAIMAIYSTADFGVDMKADHSPLTTADLAAHAILEPGLQKLITGVPVLYTSGRKEMLDIFLAEGHDPKYIGTPMPIDTYMHRDWDSWIKGLDEK